MSQIYFGNKVDMITAATPSAGGYLIGYDLDGILKQKDEFGVITEIGGGPTGGIGLTPSLYDVLGVDNDSGTYPIIMGTGTSLQSSNGNSQISLDTSGANTILISTDGTQSEQGLYLHSSDVSLFANGYSQSVTVNDGSGNTSIYNVGGVVRVGADTTSDELRVEYNSSSTASSTDVNKHATFVAARNATIAPGVINTVVLGGQGLVATQSGFVYVPNLNVNNSYNLPSTDGIVGQSLTTDGSGNLYWAASSVGLPAVLSVNNSSFIYDIIMGTGTSFQSSNGEAKIELDSGSTANTILITSDNAQTSYLSIDDDLTIDTNNTLNIGANTASVVTTNSEGLVYGFDYSGSFVTNSLVSKLYVDTGTASLYTYVDGATNSLYSYIDGGTASLWTELDNYLLLTGGTISGDLSIDGNLLVSGTQTVINTENLYVEDNIITLNATYSGPPIIDSGIEVNHGDGTYSKMKWDASEDYWVAGLSGSESPIILGSGSTNWIPKWDSINTLTSTSSIYDDGIEVTFNTPIVPGADDVYDIGTTSSRWRDIYIGSKIDFIENVEFVHDEGDIKMVVGTTSVTIKNTSDFLLEGPDSSPVVSVSTGITWVEFTNDKIYVTDGVDRIYVYDNTLAPLSEIVIPDDGWSSLDTKSLTFDSSSNKLFVGVTTDGDNEGLVCYIDVLTDTLYYNRISIPLGTLWNHDGWATMSNYESREYRSLIKVHNDNGWNWPDMVGEELIMRDDINDKYYRLMFDSWSSGGSGGGFSYSRAQITGTNSIGPTVSFIKTDYGNEVDIIDTNLHITRDNQWPIYNQALEYNLGFRYSKFSYNEPIWGQFAYDVVVYNPVDDKLYAFDNKAYNITKFDTNNKLLEVIDITTSSPAGTLWNTQYLGTSSGHSDLTDYQNRKYRSFKKSLDLSQAKGGNTQWYNNIVGEEMVMHDTINDKYYKIIFDYWDITTTGGFSYSRAEIISATSFGPTVSFIRTDGGSETDTIDTGLEIARDIPIGTPNELAIYNTAVESKYTDFHGFSIGVNTNNGDVYVASGEIYVGGGLGNIGNVAIYATNSTLVEEIWGLSFSAAPNSIAYNPTNDSMYLGHSDYIYVIDGTSRSVTATLDISTFSGAEITKIVNYNDEIVVSVDDIILNIDSSNNITQDRTLTPQVVKHATKGNDFYLYGLDNNNLVYETIINFNNEVGGLTATSDNTHLLQDKSGTLAHLDDIPVLEVPTGKVLWVDKTYGNNGTAVPYDKLKPYNTITAALTAASAGDLVYVRPGVYSESITLVDGVNVYCDPGVTVGTSAGSYAMGDNGTTVNCQWLGHATVNRYYNNSCMNFTSTNSNIYIELADIRAAGSVMILRAIDSNIRIKCENVYGSIFNGFIYRPQQNSIYDITVTGYLRGAGGDWGSTLANPWNFIYLSDGNCNVKINLNVNELIHSESTNTSAGALFGDNTSGSDTNINVNINRVTELRTLSTNSFGFIHTRGNSNINVEVKQPFTLNNDRLLYTWGSGTGQVRFKGNVTCPDSQVSYNISSNQRVIFEDSHLKRGLTGSDLNSVIQNTVDNHYLKLVNCTIEKESSGTDASSLITVHGANSDIFSINTNVILNGGSASSSAFDAFSVANGEVYFSNTRSNIDNTANITDVAPISGFIGNDTYIINIL